MHTSDIKTFRCIHIILRHTAKHNITHDMQYQYV